MRDLLSLAVKLVKKDKSRTKDQSQRFFQSYRKYLLLSYFKNSILNHVHVLNLHSILWVSRDKLKMLNAL